MSIDYSVMAIVGIEYPKLEEAFNNESVDFTGTDDLMNWIEENDLAYASPYYDVERSYWFVGIEVCIDDMTPKEVFDTLVDAHKEFTQLTGLVGKLQVCQNVN